MSKGESADKSWRISRPSSKKRRTDRFVLVDLTTFTLPSRQENYATLPHCQNPIFKLLMNARLTSAANETATCQSQQQHNTTKRGLRRRCHENVSIYLYGSKRCVAAEKRSGNAG